MDIFSALAGLAGLVLIVWTLCDLNNRVRRLEQWKRKLGPRCRETEGALWCCLEEGHDGPHLHRYSDGVALPFHMNDAAKHG